MTFHPSGGIAPAHPAASAELDAIRAELQALLDAPAAVPSWADAARLDAAQALHGRHALAQAAAHGAALLAALGLPAIDGGAL